MTSNPFEPYRGYNIRELPDGSIMLPRKNKQVEALLDSKFERVSENQRKWFPKLNGSKPVADLHNRFQELPCYIIGKGPSLDSLTLEDFSNTEAPIICLNESIRTVEKLGLENQLFMLMSDMHIDCKPNLLSTELLLRSQVGCLYPGHTRYLFKDTELSSKTLSIVRAAKIAEIMGCNHIIFLCCDAAITGDCDYADSVGYDSSKGGAKARFLGHRETTLKETNLTNEWILPKDFVMVEEDE